MDFSIPEEITELLDAIDVFIDKEIKPLEREHPEYFDHRREWARTNWDEGGIPNRAWEDLLGEARRLADEAGFYRYALPERVGGSGGSNVAMAIIREHLAAKGLGLHNELQSESSIVGNFPVLQMMLEFGTAEQQEEFLEPMIVGTKHLSFGLTEPEHGSDATWLETTALQDGSDWVINGGKRFNTGVHRATHDVVFTRTSGNPGQARGITAFIVPIDSPGFEVPFYWWTLNMPSDHGEVRLKDVRVQESAIFGELGNGLALAQHFVHENRVRQAASGVGAAQYCIDESAKYARKRVTFGQSLSERQAIQWPLAELHTEAELVRNLVYKTAWELDLHHHSRVSHHVSMSNYRANRLACNAADLAIQIHGGLGYTRHMPFEHIYRHHRRYRITEGSDEVQIRRVAGALRVHGISSEV